MKFKSNVYLISKDFKSINWVEFNFEVNINENETFRDECVEYKCTLPDYMFNELKDTEPRFKTKYDTNNRVIYSNPSIRSLTTTFKKTQYSKSLDVLKNYISDLSHIIYDKYDDMKDEYIKKIFISFTNSDAINRNGYNYAFVGEQITSKFNFFVGYEVIYKKNNPSLSKRDKYVVDKAYHPEGATLNFKERGGKGIVDGVFNNPFEGRINIKDYSIVDWTQEREDFLNLIYSKFRKLNTDLDSFLSNLDNLKLDEIIKNTPKLLL